MQTITNIPIKYIGKRVQYEKKKQPRIDLNVQNDAYIYMNEHVQH